ncbi:MAG: DUF4132 domain-containing protein [Micrococcales bacterium]|nr:DUF4132 domain-containing protein [Micrococcales bacterium]
MTMLSEGSPPIDPELPDLETVVARLSQGSGRALDAVAEIDVWPESWTMRLVTVALGGPTDVRRAVQDALDARGEAHRAVVVSALTSPRATVRLAAARWLARVPAPDVVHLLERALKAERDDAVVAALFDALVSAGQPLERYLEPHTLPARAAALVADGLPAELDWVDWSGAPRVRWATGQRVRVSVVKWLVARASRMRSAEPSARLVAYASLLRESDATELGLWLLRGWIATDLAPIDAAEAQRRARAEAAVQAQTRIGVSVDELTAAVLPRHLRTPAGSAIASTGVLGLVAATGRSGVAPTVAAYLSAWHAQRVAQSRALVAMLGWVDDPAATTLLLQVHSRFRSPGVQAEASRAVAALAERRGWTAADLLARTVPTAGADESGVLRLSYGDRVFVATLDDQPAFVLRDPDGYRVRSLPAPLVTDDVVAAHEARALLVEARRELRATVAQQEVWLQEAAATGRTWSGEAWMSLVVGHPVLVRLAARMEWTVRNPDERDPERPDVLRTVRPTPDGMVLDLTGRPVRIAPDAVVGLTRR